VSSDPPERSDEQPAATRGRRDGRRREAQEAESGDEPDPRFTFANERTFLAWNRTALALIAGGLAVAQFFEAGSRFARLAIAAPLVLLGAALAITSHGRWRANQRALRLGDPLPESGLPRVLGTGVAAVGLLTAVIVAVELIR
jgi:putative membrane protein